MDLNKYIQETPAARNWEQTGSRPQHGICIPLFSLRSKNSAGIGEYPDIALLLPWCKQIGIDIIQLLPLNDPGHEQSPYGALSAFALNPIHLHLSSLPDIDNLPDWRPLNETQRVSYREVTKFKEESLRKYFTKVFVKHKNGAEFSSFTKQNSWVENYALFKTLKDKQNWRAWSDWPDEWKNPSLQQRENLIKEYSSEVNYHIFVQYLCFQQLRNVFFEAEKYGIKLKGDIPILFSKDCADVWEYPWLFHLNYSAGAPPDMYSPEGQDWGFPLYNWPEMEKQDYRWWKERLGAAGKFFHLYRLDHIVGFYRIWAKKLDDPQQSRGFIPPDPTQWIPQGEKIMRALLRGSSMLPIGEDLGTVPPEVRANLKKMGICGTKVIRWERKWNEDRSYIRFDAYEPLSMTTVSTHDSETLKQWWKNQPEEAKEYAKFKGWTYQPELSWDQHLSILTDSHYTSSIFHINLLQEYLALVPGMNWPNPDDERINIPGIISDSNWTYRFRPTVEEIIQNKQLRNIFTGILRK